MSAVARIEELDDRISGIGGGDIASIVGLSSFRTAWDVFAAKRRLVDPPDEAALPEYMRWGALLQRPILEEDGRLEKAEDLEFYFDSLFRHPERPWQIGHPDADRPPSGILVEAKTVGLFQAHQYGEAGTDSIPERDIVQVQWYMSLLDREAAHVAVLVGGQELRVFTVQRNRPLEAFLLEKAERFWTDHVLADEPPPLGDSEAAAAYLKKSFPRETIELRPPTDKEFAIVETYADARANFAHWEALKKGLENQLKFHIGNAAGLSGDDWKISWKKTADGSATSWENAAREALQTLQMIAAAETEEARAAGIEVARAACTDLIAKHTRKKLGSRRFLPTGRLFKEQSGETNG